MCKESGKRGKVVIVSGPSGVGKGTILCRLYALNEFALRPSVSATTRAPRPGEVDGKDYHFLSPAEFKMKKDNGQFLECFEVFASGDWYGTLRDEVENALSQGVSVVLEIDVQGAREILKTYADAVTVFISPPDRLALEQRLIHRGTEDSATRQRRLDTAMAELNQRNAYKYEIVNDSLDDAVEELRMILKKEIP
ncbi:MAG: guanylate kinase [Thermoguttaceae bacterium]|nr:guanylate kinase [Thermoguttaceae bacterium]